MPIAATSSGNKGLLKAHNGLAQFGKVASVHLLAFSLVACQLFPDDENSTTQETNQSTVKRASLADLAKSIQQANEDDKFEQEQLVKQRLSKQIRSTKLAEIYQAMLTLEPDTNVRAQINYRLVELDTEYFQEFGLTELDAKSSDVLLAKLISDYQGLLKRYPNRPENEKLYYQLAKAYDLQGELGKSLVITQQLVALYPQTQHLAELAFRQAEIYYSQQDYSNALAAYQRVLTAEQNEKYRLNSIYMSGWSHFKANNLVKADQEFMKVLSELIREQLIIKTSQERIVAKYQQFDSEELRAASGDDFAQLSQSKQSLVGDTLRILTISLSQQEQVQSLIALFDSYQPLTEENQHVAALEHVLFKALASFLIEKKLDHDAELTYQAYIRRNPSNIWSTRFSLALIAMAKKRGDHPQVRALQQGYVEQYGLNSEFWLLASPKQQQEVIPSLLQFSEQRSRRLYANAQDSKTPETKISAFANAANWLGGYLEIVKFTQDNYPETIAEAKIDLIAEESLYADASFEAQHYKNALTSYQYLAYGNIIGSAEVNSQAIEQINVTAELSEKHAQIKQAAAYATTLTIRKLLLSAQASEQTVLINQRAELDRAFVVNYPRDERAKVLASQAAQYSFASDDFDNVHFYSDFILSHYDITSNTLPNAMATIKAKFSTTAFKQVQIASQLKANSFYQQQQYSSAEQSYLLALNFVSKKNSGKAVKSKADKAKVYEINELIASSIYLQGQAAKENDPELAIEHWLRLGNVTPKASYRANAEFDAANLLLSNQHWGKAVSVLLAFQQQFPSHEYSISIPAKLADSYQQLAQYDRAAEQLIIMQKTADSTELKRELQYSIAENYLKAKDIEKAIIHFRTYAHSYPEPFAIAQEVRFKMSEFYRETNEPNKRYFWYRKLLSSHKTSVTNSSNINLELVVQQRSTYLVSMAAYELGRAHQQSFNAAKLTLPLNKSLKRKQKSLKQAVSYYQQVFGFGLAEFVPKANYQLASMYQLLAADVLASQLPKGLDELAAEEYSILLEELAYPFEEKAIELYSSNAERAWQGLYDEWIKKSFIALATLEPAKFDKTEKQPEVIYALF